MQMNWDVRHLGVKKLVAGALLLLNAFVWPQWLGIDGWIKFIAVLMVIGGFVMLVWHPGQCSICPPKVLAKKVKKKKK